MQNKLDSVFIGQKIQYKKGKEWTIVAVNEDGVLELAQDNGKTSTLTLGFDEFTILSDRPTAYGYDPMMIAFYLLKYLSDNNASIDNWKLQKELFLIQELSVKKLGRFCFVEDFYSYQTGPVIKTVYEYFRTNGNNLIKLNRYYYFKDIEKIELSKYAIDSDMIQIIEKVGDVCKEMTNQDLLRAMEIAVPWKSGFTRVDKKINKSVILKTAKVQEAELFDF